MYVLLPASSSQDRNINAERFLVSRSPSSKLHTCPGRQSAGWRYATLPPTSPPPPSSRWWLWLPSSFPKRSRRIAERVRAVWLWRQKPLMVSSFVSSHCSSSSQTRSTENSRPPPLHYLCSKLELTAPCTRRPRGGATPWPATPLIWTFSYVIRACIA